MTIAGDSFDSVWVLIILVSEMPAAVCGATTVAASVPVAVKGYAADVLAMAYASVFLTIVWQRLSDMSLHVHGLAHRCKQRW